MPTSLLPVLKGRTFSVDLPVSTAPDSDTFKVSTIVSGWIAFSLRTSDKSLAKVRHATALRSAEAFLSSALTHSSALNAPATDSVELSFRDIIALVGMARRQLLAEHEANPFDDDHGVWVDRIETVEHLDLSSDKAAAAAISVLLPILDVKAFLHQHYVEGLAPASLREFVRQLVPALVSALKLVYQRSSGDYSPDPDAARYPSMSTPPFESDSGSLVYRPSNERSSHSDSHPPSQNTERRSVASPRTASSVTTFDELFERWRKETRPAASTLSTWQGYVKQFATFVGHTDPHKATEEDALRWKDHLLAKGLKDINNGHLAALRRLYGYGLENSATSGIRSSPFASVKARQKKLAGTGRLPFTHAEVGLILRSARTESLPYLRWVPWLQAMSGSRVAEIVQLWGSMISEDEGIPCIHIRPAPDGGSLKNEGSERVIPIHPDLIADGFLDFVKVRGNGPLFYNETKHRAAAARADGQSIHKSKGIANRVGGWVRKLGIDNPRKAPTHSFRHWFKTEMGRANVPERLVDAIQGHRNPSEAATYYHADPSMKLEAIKKLDLNTLAIKTSPMEQKEQEGSASPVIP